MLFWDDVSAGAEDGQIVKTNNQSKWQQNGNVWGSPFQFKKDLTRSGTQSEIYFGVGHKNFLGNPKYNASESTRTKLYVSWWYKPGKSPADEGGSNKFIRIWDNPNGYGTRISWTQMHLTCGTNNESPNNVSWKQWNGNVNQWNHKEIYVDLDERYIKAWLNGSLVHDLTCEKSKAYANVPLYISVLGFDHGDTTYRSMNTSIDDIYIGSSLARVEISNSPKWTPVMIKEIVPISAWSDKEILTLPINGVVRLSSDLYVYVLNEKNEVNKDGFKVTCNQCPKAPLQP